MAGNFQIAMDAVLLHQVYLITICCWYLSQIVLHWWVQCCAKLTCITSYTLIEARPKLVLGRMAQFIFICTLHNQLGQCVDDLWVHQEFDPLKHCSSQKFIMSCTQHTYYQTPLSHVKFGKKPTNFGTNKENYNQTLALNTCGSLIWSCSWVVVAV